jgi:hypothetical protein
MCRALALQTDLTFDALKALTPMETVVDEANLSRLLHDAARAAKEKIDQIEHRPRMAVPRSRLIRPSPNDGRN